MTALLLLLLSAGPAHAAGLPEFEAPLCELRAAVLAQPFVPAAATAARPQAPRRPPLRAADPETWARALERARLRTDSTQTLRIGDAEYKVFVALSSAALPAQQCPAGHSPRSALYVAEAAAGPGGAVYPARLVSLCVGPALTLVRLAADADAEGFIQDSSFWDPASGRQLRPSEEKLTSAQQARFDAALAELVRLFAQ